MGINRFYHQKKSAQENWDWKRLFRIGSEIEIGKTYSAIRQKSGMIGGPFTALAYESGTLLTGDPGSNRYCIIDCDVADVNGLLVTDRIRGGVFSIKRDIDEIPDSEEEAIEWLQNASRVKWFFALTKEEATLFRSWLRKR